MTLAEIPMSVWVGVAAAAGAIALVATRGRGGESALHSAIKTGDVSDIVTRLESQGGPSRLTAYDKTISSLWRDYHRDVAAKLVAELAPRHPDEHVTQYWLGQVKAVEPEVFDEVIGAEFFRKWHRPSIAADCGKFG